MIDTIKTIIIIILCLYVIVYSLRPSTRNPEWIMQVHKHPWILIPLLLITYYIMLWDTKIGVLLIIILLAIYMDIIMFIKKV